MEKGELSWETRAFNKLSPYGLYDIVQARIEVFAVEQECIYQDLDGKDLKGHHLTGYAGEKLAAYARLLPPGISYEEASIGRIITTMAFRGTGVGKELVRRSIAEIERLYQTRQIKISAQERLQAFYEGLGFVKTSEAYIEDGIPHIEMLIEK